MWEKILRAFAICSGELQSPKLDLTVAPRLLISNQNPECSVIRAFDDEVINSTTEQAFQVSVIFNTVGTPLMQLRKRFSCQQSVTLYHSSLYFQIAL